MSGRSRCRTMRTSRGRPQSGFTLAELMLSAAIMSILMTGVASAILIASRALPDPSTPIEALLRSSDVAEQMATELYCALDFTERTATAVEFRVPDRNADLAAETIRYAWSGTPGAPLTRQYNGGTVVKVLTDVQEFDLAYTLRTLTETVPQEVAVDSGEVLLEFFDGWPGIPADPVARSSWTSEYFMADIPADAKQLKVTRVLMQMRQVPGATGSRSVAIHKAIGGADPGGGNPEPMPTPIGTPVTVPNATLPLSFEWVSVMFSDVMIDNPGKEYCIVTKNSAPLAGEVLYYYSRFAPDDFTTPVGLWSTDNGATWEPRSSKRNQNDIPFYAYGSYTTTSLQDVDVSHYFLTGARIRLRAGVDSATAVETTTQVLNEPEVAAP